MAYSGTQIDLCNLALNLCGSNVPVTDGGDGLIANTPDQTVEAMTAKAWYPISVGALLEAHPWSFAAKIATLVLASDGTGEVWADTYDNAFVYPADCKRLRGFIKDPQHVTGTYAGHQDLTYQVSGLKPSPWTYEVKTHGGQKVIFTDVSEDNADMEYTKLTLDPAEFSDRFAEALAYKMAASMSVPLAVSDGKSNRALAVYEMCLRQAKADNANEQRPRNQRDGSYVTRRLGVS